MSIKYTCPVCNTVFSDRDKFMSHLIAQHWQNLKKVLLKEVINKCPGRSCSRTHHTETLNPRSVCACGYPIGRWAFRRIAGAWATIHGRETQNTAIT